MRPTPNQRLERMRVIDLELERFGETYPGEASGIFMCRRRSTVLRMICGVGHGWEHVSISTEHRVPHWDEMCYIKDLFWLPEEWVVQFHPAASQYVNCHPYTLHLWKCTSHLQPIPPKEFV